MIKDTSAQDISVTKKNNFAKPVALIIGVLLIGSVLAVFLRTPKAVFPLRRQAYKSAK